MAGVCERECMRLSPGDKPLKLTRCHSCGLSQLYEALGGGNLSVFKPATKGYNGGIFLFFYFVFLILFYYGSPFLA